MNGRMNEKQKNDRPLKTLKWIHATNVDCKRIKYSELLFSSYAFFSLSLSFCVDLSFTRPLAGAKERRRVRNECMCVWKYFSVAQAEKSFVKLQKCKGLWDSFKLYDQQHLSLSLAFLFFPAFYLRFYIIIIIIIISRRNFESTLLTAGTSSLSRSF